MHGGGRGESDEVHRVVESARVSQVGEGEDPVCAGMRTTTCGGVLDGRDGLALLRYVTLSLMVTHHSHSYLHEISEPDGA